MNEQILVCDKYTKRKNDDFLRYLQTPQNIIIIVWKIPMLLMMMIIVGMNRQPAQTLCRAPAILLNA